MKGMLNIVTYNVNGVRAALRKGFADWLKEAQPEIVCLQEIKAAKEDFDQAVFEALGYQCYLFPAQKKGYSGVAILTKIKPDAVTYGAGHPDYDSEGRNIRIDIGSLSILSAYFPSGTTGDLRQGVKMQYLDFMFGYLQELRKSRPQLVVCGDYNICHTNIDIHDPVRNKNVSGFKPEEREWMSKYLDAGFVDSFRKIHPGLKDQYTWWSQFANARANNKGWRIDYIAVTDNLEDRIVDAKILPEARHSDHCPVWLSLKQ
ncbi:MAG: exodeoxyribonuclease III [Chitinophagales bacterium]